MKGRGSYLKSLGFSSPAIVRTRVTWESPRGIEHMLVMCNSDQLPIMLLIKHSLCLEYSYTYSETMAAGLSDHIWAIEEIVGL